MHDFEDVLNFQLEQPRRRAAKPVSPSPKAKKEATAAAAAGRKDASAAARLSPPGDAAPCLNIAAGPKSDATQQGKAASTGDTVAPPSTARHPGAEREVSEARTIPATATTASDSAKKQHSVEVPSPKKASSGGNGLQATPATAAAKSKASAGKEFVTPAVSKRAAQTPVHHHPSTARRSEPPSEHRPALADGQFQPTPLPTPHTVVATAQGRTSSGAFRSPQPRTIFANKKRRSGALDSTGKAPTGRQQPPQPAVSSVAPPRGTLTAPRTSQEASCVEKRATPLPSLQLVNPPIPTPGSKGPRSAGTKPKLNLTFVAEHAPAPKRVKDHPAKSVAKAGAAPPAHEDPPINLAKFGKGPVIPRPPTCPPLFKNVPLGGGAGAFRSPRSTVAPMELTPEWGGSAAMMRAPSAVKISQASALGGQFFAQEKGLLGMFGGGPSARPSLPLGSMGAVGMGTAALPAAPASSAGLPVQHAEAQPQQPQQQLPGSKLLWACQQLALQQGQ